MYSTITEDTLQLRSIKNMNQTCRMKSILEHF